MRPPCDILGPSCNISSSVICKLHFCAILFIRASSSWIGLRTRTDDMIRGLSLRPFCGIHLVSQGVTRNSMRTGAGGSIYLTAGYPNAKYHVGVISEQCKHSLNILHKGFVYRFATRRTSSSPHSAPPPSNGFRTIRTTRPCCGADTRPGRQDLQHDACHAAAPRKI